MSGSRHYNPVPDTSPEKFVQINTARQYPGETSMQKGCETPWWTPITTASFFSRILYIKSVRIFHDRQFSIGYL